MNRRGIPILAALIGMVGILCLAVLVIDNVKRDQVTEQRLVDRATQVAEQTVDDATEPGGALDDAVQAEVEEQVDDALATTTTAPPSAVPSVPTTTTTTTTTQPPLLPAVTTTLPPVITLPTLPPTTLPEIPLP